MRCEKCSRLRSGIEEMKVERWVLTAIIYEKCRRQNRPKNRKKSKTSNFSKSGLGEVFEIGGFDFLPIRGVGKKTKTSKTKNRWKIDVLEIFEVLVFGFLVGFRCRHFSYIRPFLIASIKKYPKSVVSGIFLIIFLDTSFWMVCLIASIIEHPKPLILDDVPYGPSHNFIQNLLKILSWYFLESFWISTYLHQ